MEAFSFAHPWFLILLLPLLVGIVWRWRRRAPAIAVSSVSLFEDRKKRRRGPERSAHTLLLLEGIALLLFVVALARPQRSLEVRPVTREGIDIMLALDFSNSMDVYDPDPDLSPSEIEGAIERGELVDRLAVAVSEIKRFIERRPGDRIGLTVFGNEGLVASPPTLDHDFLRGLADQIGSSLLSRIERGTNIASGLVTAINTLPEQSDSRRCIILITDGAHSVEDPDFTPETAAYAARDRGIAVHSIGIGGESPYARDEYLKRAPNVDFETRTIERVAEITGGRFFRAKDNSGFENVMNLIDELETTSRVHPALIVKRDLFHGFLLAGGIFLSLAFLLGRTVLLSIS